MISIDTSGRRVRKSFAQTSRLKSYITFGLSGRWPIGWLSTPATTRSGARSISLRANEPPMQLPKKKNWRMPRWSISPNWSSAKAYHGVIDRDRPRGFAACGVALVHGDAAEFALVLIPRVDDRGRP